MRRRGQYLHTRGTIFGQSKNYSEDEYKNSFQRNKNNGKYT
jgi:hypothetical protein